MLIGEAGDMQAVCLRALGDAYPIDVHRDVRVTNSLERRIQMSMFRADLNACIKLVAPMPVIDREDIAASQFRRNIVDPMKCRLIESPFFPRRLGSCRSLGKRALDEHKPVALKIDQFFFALANQTNRHGIEQ